MTQGPVVITGATGFIGRAVTSRYLAEGRPVIALVRPTSQRELLPEHELLQVVEYESLDSVELADELRALAPSAFLHLGWAGVDGAARRQVDQVGINVPATIASVELASASGCGRWVGIGSQAEYGPSSETLTEDTPLKPNSSYGRAKAKAWAAAHETAEMLGLSHAWARVFSVYGPGDHVTAVLPHAIGKLLQGRVPELGACEQDWDFLFVDDAAEALVMLVDSVASGAFNLASGSAAPLRAAIELADAAVGSSVHPIFADAPSSPAAPLRADITRLTSAIGWTPSTTIEDGVYATVRAMAATAAGAAGGAA